MLLFSSLQLKSFHNELLSELEKKVDLDARYLTVSLSDGIQNPGDVLTSISTYHFLS